MRNITLSVEESSYRAARIRAAELDTSVSELVRSYFDSLREKPEQDRVGELFAAMDRNLLQGGVSGRERDRGVLHER